MAKPHVTLKKSGATAVVAAPWILSAVTIYGLYDVYVGVKTGGKMSAADLIGNT